MNDLRPGSEIADGVHWLKDRFVNNYLVEKDDALILIDTAFNKKATGIMDYIKAELSDMRVSEIYLTHHHSDHIGGAHHLQETFHPQFYAGEADIPVIVGQEKMPLPNNIFLKPIFYIIRPFLSRKPLDEARVEPLRDGLNSNSFHVHHLPGHTMGSMGFQRDNVLFSGDAAVTDDGKVTLGTNMFAESKEAARNSIRILGDLEIDMILPGHGKPLLEDASLRVKDAIDRLDQ